MSNTGFVVLFTLLVAGCGQSGNQSAGSAPANPAPGAGSGAQQAQLPKDTKEQPGERRQLPPSEPYGTTGN